MQVKINKRSVYAPLRYEATRPFATGLADKLAALERLGAEAFNEFWNWRLMPILDAELHKIGPKGGFGPLCDLGPQGAFGPHMPEIRNLEMFRHYRKAGKVIYDVSAVLSTALARADAGDLPCCAVSVPCDAFYLHFGSPSHTQADAGDGGYEGAFVDFDRKANILIVYLVDRGWGIPARQWTDAGELLATVHVEFDDPERTIAQALAESLKGSDDTYLSFMERVKPHVDPLYVEAMEHAFHNTSPSEEEQQAIRMHAGLSMVVNVLLYLAAEPDDVIHGWSDEVPPEAVRALQNAKPASQVKALETTLAQAGYTKVRVVGTNFARAVSSHGQRDAASTGRTVAPHLRDWHFKRQPYGPNRSLRKVIFVNRVVVNAGKGEVRGRIYAHEQAQAPASA